MMKEYAFIDKKKIQTVNFGAKLDVQNVSLIFFLIKIDILIKYLMIFPTCNFLIKWNMPINMNTIKWLKLMSVNPF